MTIDIFPLIVAEMVVTVIGLVLWLSSEALKRKQLSENFKKYQKLASVGGHITFLGYFATLLTASLIMPPLKLW